MQEYIYKEPRLLDPECFEKTGNMIYHTGASQIAHHHVLQSTGTNSNKKLRLQRSRALV